MSLKILQIGGFNPFDVPGFCCPLCGGAEFSSLSHSSIWCDYCNARFNVRDTAGDPGCVVDCFCTQERGAHIYAPSFECDQCNDRSRHARFDWEDKTCPHNMNHGEMTREKGISVPWKAPKDKEYFYMILKLGDYCSGWLIGGAMGGQRPGPSQEQWDEFQHAREEARTS